MTRNHNQLTAKLLCLALSLFSTHSAQALILYSGDNSANQTAPDTARTDIFNSVGRVIDSSMTKGSAVHLRGKYLLTANHVGGLSYVTFDGTTLYARDTSFTPVTFGSVDMKLIKLVDDPGLADTQLFSGSTGDTPYFSKGHTVYTTATMVGWGRGRSPSDPDGLPTWDWGTDSTIAKRWGTNRIESATTLSYTFGQDYTYTALTTKLNASSGNDEVATAYYDSGSGLFIDDGGTWKLAGLTTVVSTNGSSTFSDSTGDTNYFVRITAYASDIEAAIPDTNTYSGWKIDHGLYGNDALDTADTDGDGISQLLEFAFLGDPNESDRSILPGSTLTQENGSTYLEISYTRTSASNGLTYTVKTTTDLTNWPTDSTGVDTPIVVGNGDGTETWTYRRTLAVSGANMAFMRVDVSL